MSLDWAKTLEIRIQGSAHSGKTAVTKIIEDALRAAGMRVMLDEGVVRDGDYPDDNGWSDKAESIRACLAERGTTITLFNDSTNRYGSYYK